jgi:hypothetical protein
MMPGRLVLTSCRKSFYAGPVNCIRSFGAIRFTATKDVLLAPGGCAKKSALSAKPE